MVAGAEMDADRLCNGLFPLKPTQLDVVLWVSLEEPGTVFSPYAAGVPSVVGWAEKSVQATDWPGTI